MIADWMRQQMLSMPTPAGVESLSGEIMARHGDAVLAIVFYGSCRRTQDAGDGLVDLLVLVKNYQAVHGARPMALANRLLPPNVYYLEVDATRNGTPQGLLSPDSERRPFSVACASRRIPPAPPSQTKGETVSHPPSSEGGMGGMQSVARYRSKYAVIALADFERRCRRGLDAYFWARFAQPAQLAFSRSEEITSRIAHARANAAARFARSGAGLCRGNRDAQTFWIHSLQASYRCELRPERPQAAVRLIEADRDYYSELSESLLPALPFVTRLDAHHYHFAPRVLRRARARAEWFARRFWGKTLNLARLFKATGTFTNGIDYLVWKVERHSGVRIQPTEFMRRHPRLAAFGLAWRLWRQGAL